MQRYGASSCGCNSRCPRGWLGSRAVMPAQAAPLLAPRSIKQQRASGLLRQPRCSAADEQRSAPQPHSVSEEETKLKYDHLLLAILDDNPYLSDASKQAVGTAARLASNNDSKVTVLLLDKQQPEGDPAVRINSLQWHLKDKGCKHFEFLERQQGSNASAAVGDVADELNADMLIVSSAAVHSKQVDGNLLAEFVPCPLLMLP